MRAKAGGLAPPGRGSARAAGEAATRSSQIEKTGSSTIVPYSTSKHSRAHPAAADAQRIRARDPPSAESSAAYAGSRSDGTLRDACATDGTRPTLRAPNTFTSPSEAARHP